MCGRKTLTRDMQSIIAELAVEDWEDPDMELEEWDEIDLEEDDDGPWLGDDGY